MDIKQAIKVNAYPQNFSAGEVRAAQLAILAAVATCERSFGVQICPLCGEPQPQKFHPDGRKRHPLAAVDPFGPRKAA